jgi:hypothetical protein
VPELFDLNSRHFENEQIIFDDQNDGHQRGVLVRDIDTLKTNIMCA